LRKREPFRLKLPAGSIKNALVALGGILLIVHIGILVMFIAGGLMLKSYNNAWANVQPEKRQLDEFKDILNLTKQYEELFSRLVKERLSIAPKLNCISDVLTPGVWLSELSISGGIFQLKGSCVSASAQEMARIGGYLNGLRQNNELAKDFARLELISVQRRKIGPQEVVDFYISSKDLRGK
jgi:hypothetical protein